jgi:cobalt transporter subunit CbtA
VPLSAGALRALLLPALLAGLAGGLAAACLQQLLLVPMILQAEAIELGGPEHVHHGLDRVLYTTLFDCLGAFGFALLLAAGLILRGRVSWKQGLAWGLAGCASFALAPALGLPPELPGVESASLIARQCWWIATALATAGGIACLLLAPKRGAKLLGVVMIVLPHCVGAPAGDALHSLAGPLARNFALGSLATSLVMWAVIGVVTAALMNRVAAPTSAAQTPSKAGT